MYITDNWYYPLVRYCSYVYSIKLPEKSCWLSIHMCSMQFEDFENAVCIFYHITVTPHLPPVLQTHSPLRYVPFDACVNALHLWYFSPECGPCCDAWLTVLEHEVLHSGKRPSFSFTSALPVLRRPAMPIWQTPVWAHSAHTLLTRCCVAIFIWLGAQMNMSCLFTRFTWSDVMACFTDL